MLGYGQIRLVKWLQETFRILLAMIPTIIPMFLVSREELTKKLSRNFIKLLLNYVLNLMHPGLKLPELSRLLSRPFNLPKIVLVRIGTQQ